MDNVQAASNIAVVYTDVFLLHDTGAGHPENPQRLSQVVTQLKHDTTLNNRLIWPDFTAADKPTLALVHTPAYLNLVARESQAVAHGGYATLSTGDTVLSPQTDHVARLAVGASLAAVDAVMTRQAGTAFALVRPPGHHATAERGMGFCLYNNVAIAARYLQQHYGLHNILIVDIDVHHGNGTQAIFYADDSVFYFSAHQSPLYPGTGDPTETGVGKGLGSTLNIAVPAGSDGAITIAAMKEKLLPAMQHFKPQFVLVSAGFDAHTGDALGGLNYSDADYAKITESIQIIANTYAQGKTVYVLEGGYSPANIANAVTAILHTY